MSKFFFIKHEGFCLFTGPGFKGRASHVLGNAPPLSHGLAPRLEFLDIGSWATPQAHIKERSFQKIYPEGSRFQTPQSAKLVHYSPQ